MPTLPPVAAPPTLRTIALAGNPNAGKTTLFNRLTGLHQKVGNYPGVTVERKVGRCWLASEHPVQVIDLPGTYSLIPGSLDEQVTTDVLAGRRADTPRPDVIVAVVDGSNLPRSLYLVSQLIDLGRPLVIALNMVDIAARRGLEVDAEALGAALGIAVIPVVSHRGRGITALHEAILQATVPHAVTWELPPVLAGAVRTLGLAIGPDAHGRELARRLLIGDEHGIPRELIDRLQPELAQQRATIAAAGIDAVEADIVARYRWIDALVERVVRRGAAAARVPLTERVDAVLMHPVAGLAVFAVVMTVVFIAVFFLAKPLMDGVGDGIAWLGDVATRHLADGALKSLITDGIVGGVGAVVTFVPQIAILFLFLAILEDSGYLARAAFLMDRVLAKAGLHGKSFIPLLSSFACAIPGILATRTIDTRRDRLVTILVAPFMSCSARLPVYLLLIETCFAPVLAHRWKVEASLIEGLIMTGLYLLGILAAVGTALIVRHGILRRGAPSSFILEMPSYKLPQASEVLRQMWVNASAFLTKAGTIIFTLSVILWAAMYWPRLPEARAHAIATEVSAQAPAPGDSRSPEERIADRCQAEQVRQSFGGRLGHAIAPVLAPIGVDWKTGIGLVGAFAAREVFVSTLGIVHGVGDTEKDAQARASLPVAMREDRTPAGRPVWTPLVATSVLVWFVLAMQCMSTVAVVRRESGGWAWPLAMLVYMNALAYAACVIVYQGGLRLFGG